MHRASSLVRLHDLRLPRPYRHAAQPAATRKSRARTQNSTDILTHKKSPDLRHFLRNV